MTIFSLMKDLFKEWQIKSDSEMKIRVFEIN